MMLASGLQTAWEQIDSMRKVPNNFRFYIVLDVEQRPWSFKVEVIMWYLRSYYKVKVSKIIIFILYITDDQGPATSMNCQSSLSIKSLTSVCTAIFTQVFLVAIISQSTMTRKKRLSANFLS